MAFDEGVNDSEALLAHIGRKFFELFEAAPKYARAERHQRACARSHGRAGEVAGLQRSSQSDGVDT